MSMIYISQLLHFCMVTNCQVFRCVDSNHMMPKHIAQHMTLTHDQDTSTLVLCFDFSHLVFPPGV